VRLVGFVVRIYYEARSSECQTLHLYERGFSASYAVLVTKYCVIQRTSLLVLDQLHIVDAVRRTVETRDIYSASLTCNKSTSTVLSIGMLPI